MFTQISKYTTEYFTILALSSIFCSCASYRNDYKLYCKKGDLSSIRIIPKREPFTPVVDSVSKYISLTVSNLNDYNSKVDIGKKQMLLQLIQKIDNKTFLNLSFLKAIYEAYRTRPCDESAYKDYQNNLSKYQDYLINIKDLYKDVQQITKSSGISGNSSSVLLDRISQYLITRNERN